MNAGQHWAEDGPLDELTQLREELHLTVPLLTLGEGDPRVIPILAGLRATVERTQQTVEAAEPDALCALRSGLAHAAAGEHNESRTELLNAYRLLSALLPAEGRANTLSAPPSAHTRQIGR